MNFGIELVKNATKAGSGLLAMELVQGLVKKTREEQIAFIRDQFCRWVYGETQPTQHYVRPFMKGVWLDKTNREVELALEFVNVLPEPVDMIFSNVVIHVPSLGVEVPVPMPEYLIDKTSTHGAPIHRTAKLNEADFKVLSATLENKNAVRASVHGVWRTKLPKGEWVEQSFNFVDWLGLED